ncbi:hypothetical protein EV361DRAFT_920724 [Lentinula raphanica]|nr:hypothetical protein F5880DRAFT_1547125 [Lentinula raphanica]KAJ3969473.1 hypothetical protein EV361DRAFT_920724 [Lentinula raphanica]
MPNSTTNDNDENGWQIVSTTDGWRISFEEIPWSYQPSSSRKTRCKALCRPVISRSRPPDIPDARSADLEQELNSDFVGFATACDVLSAYEADSGFHYKFCLREDDPAGCAPKISQQIDDNEVEAGREIWNEMMQSLTGDFTDEQDTSSGSDSSSLSSSLILDSGDWDYPNYVSMPATPKPHASNSHGYIRSGPTNSPASRLNASASSFIPSSSSVPSLTYSNNASPATTRSSPSPPLHDFVFPSLNPPKPSTYPKFKVEKDDQGFYTSIDTEMNTGTPKSRTVTQSSTLLPAFLQDDHTQKKTLSSRTRTLVDRLRSRQSTAHPGPGSDSTPDSPDSNLSFSRPNSASRVPTHSSTASNGDNDGWIGLEEPNPSELSRRRQGPTLSVAITPTHRRTGSGPAALETETPSSSSSSPSSQEAALSTSSTSSSSDNSSPMLPTPPIVTNDDGWIEVSDAPHKSAHARKSSAFSKVKPASEPLIFPTLNAPPPPSNTRPSRSHVRGASSTSSSSKSSTKASQSPYAGIPPFAAAPMNYFVPIPPTLPVAVQMPYAPYMVKPVMPYATVPTPYHPQQFAYQQQAQAAQQYTSHQRAQSVGMPSTAAMPAYAKPGWIVPAASPMANRTGLW